MKKLVAVFVAILLCLWMISAPVLADDTEPAPESTDTTITSPEYPPPPDGYVGVWPPPDPDILLDGGGPPPPEADGDGGDDGGWDVPGE